MEKEPILIVIVAALAGIAYYITRAPSAILSPARSEMAYLYHIWTGLSITVAIIVIGLVVVSIIKFRVKK